MKDDYLSMNRNDMSIRGRKQCDFVYVFGNAHVDHPSFGTAIISRLLEARGYRVGIIPQPGWKGKKSTEMPGRPRLDLLVSAGNMDSMVNHYSVSKKRRKEDSYTPGGVMGKRPDYVVVVYCSLIRSVYKDVSVVIGGIEASLRCLAHYGYWSDKLKRSVLPDSQTDLISYGIGERSTVEIADALDSGLDVKDITFVDGTVYKTKSLESAYDYKMLSDYKELLGDKKEYAKSFYVQYGNTDPLSGKRLVEFYGNQLFAVQNPPSKPLSQEKMDEVYALPYMKNYHPSYEELEGVPAIREIKFSLISNWGCFGACSFCTLIFRQGRIIQVRSHEFLVKEARLLTEKPDFKGYIHGVGGPTADFRFPTREKQLTSGVCPGRQCPFPEPCKSLRADHSNYIALLRKPRILPKVKKILIRSGIRFDYVLADSNREFLKELCEFHVSGQLKVAPEHVVDKVLARMGKLRNSVYRQFVKEHKEMNQRLDKEQYLVSYLMSSRPGPSMKEVVELAEYLRDLGYMPEQVQDFYPAPSTVFTCMYYTGYDCRAMEQVYVSVNPHEKATQRAPTRYRNPRNYDLVMEALKIAGCMDLIRYDKKCLICPRNGNKDDGTAAPVGKARGNGYKVAGQGAREARRPKKTIRNIHKKKGTRQV